VKPYKKIHYICGTMSTSDLQTIREHLKRIALYDSHSDFQVVYNYYYHKLFRQALYYFNNPDIAQEVTADVFVAIWQARKVLDKVDNPDAYFFIALKHARAKYVERRYQNQPELFTDQLPETTSGTRADSELLDEELQEKYRVAFQKLPPRCAEVFRLVREEKKKYAEAAQLLNISIKTIDNQMNKAVKILYTELKEHLFFAFF
jgi:RNA polymerase sigma-70 factor (ECF subfamily)